MSKRGENIYKRKDGRWEGRYIKERSADGKARYAYVYGKSYADAKQKLLDRRIAQAQNIDCSPSHTKYGDILRNWIAMSRVHIKESTYSRYVHLANAHILPYLGELPTDKLTTQGSFLPSPAVVHSRRGPRRGRPSRAYCRTPLPTAAPASRQAARCYSPLILQQPTAMAFAAW